MYVLDLEWVGGLDFFFLEFDELVDFFFGRVFKGKLLRGKNGF